MALNLASAVIYIRYSLEDFIPPKYLSCVQSVLQFFFLVGTFVGILLACMKWRSVDDREDKNMVPQYPYGAGQYQSYQAYQQQNQAQMQHQYPQQYYQQPYPQPAQQAYQQPVAHHTPKPEQVRTEN
jgi:hypothetical protein